MARTTRIELRCTPTLKAAITAAAVADGRSVSNWCETTLAIACANELGDALAPKRKTIHPAKLVGLLRTDDAENASIHDDLAETSYRSLPPG